MLRYILICLGMFCLGAALGCAVNDGDKLLAAFCLVTAYAIGYIMRMMTAEQSREERETE